MRKQLVCVFVLAAIGIAIAGMACTYKSENNPKPPAAWTPPPRPGAEDYYGPAHAVLVEFTSTEN